MYKPNLLDVDSCSYLQLCLHAPSSHSPQRYCVWSQHYEDSGHDEGWHCDEPTLCVHDLVSSGSMCKSYGRMVNRCGSLGDIADS